MDFKTKNSFIVRHTSEEHFEDDKKLFIEKCKPSQLHNDLARVNRFNRKQFDGRMLTALLDAGVAPEAILANRKKANAPAPSAGTQLLPPPPVVNPPASSQSEGNDNAPEGGNPDKSAGGGNVPKKKAKKSRKK